MLVQGNLFDELAPADAELVPAVKQVQRIDLGRGAWVDLLPGWLNRADDLFDRLLTAVPWVGERRWMYEREVDVPRLLAFYDEADELPDPVLERCRDRLNAYYAEGLGQDLVTAGLCLYRDGRDSVAWHADTVGRKQKEDTIVAIVSLGSPRYLGLRPIGGRQAHRFALGHGDLVVMGGSCQRTWEHAVLKTAKTVGSRISVQFRPHGVR